MKLTSLLIFTFSSLTLISCLEKKTENPIECYTCWAGQKPPNYIKVLHGKYWQSGHLSKEYISYMEIQAPIEWRSKLIKQNHLIINDEKFQLPSDAPVWFKPTFKYKTWKSNDSFSDSRYYEDTINNLLYIYEIQL